LHLKPGEGLRGRQRHIAGVAKVLVRVTGVEDKANKGALLGNEERSNRGDGVPDLQHTAGEQVGHELAVQPAAPTEPSVKTKFPCKLGLLMLCVEQPTSLTHEKSTDVIGQGLGQVNGARSNAGE